MSVRTGANAGAAEIAVSAVPAYSCPFWHLQINQSVSMDGRISSPATSVGLRSPSANVTISEVSAGVLGGLSQAGWVGGAVNGISVARYRIW